MQECNSFPLFTFSSVSWNARALFIPAFRFFISTQECKSVIHSLFLLLSQYAGMQECNSFPLFTFLSVSWNARALFIPAFRFFISKQECKSVIHSHFSLFYQ